MQILGGQCLRSYAWDCVFAGVHFCLSGYFYAYGLSIVSFIHNSISIICARIPLSYYAATHFPDIMVSYVISDGMCSPGGINFVYYRLRDRTGMDGQTSG